MNEKKRVYLAGWSGLFEWRKYVKDTYSNVFDLVDPIEKTNDDIERMMGIPNLAQKLRERTYPLNKDINKLIVNIDKAYIASCELVVAYVEKPTFGTSMEIMFCHMNNIPVYVINPGLTFRLDPWLSEHVVKMFKSTEDCMKYLIIQEGN